jgi:transposase
MQTVVDDRREAPAAIHNDLGAIFVSLELSGSTWLITSLSPGGGEKMSKHPVRGGHVAGLLERFAERQKKAQARTGGNFPIIVIQEAGSKTTSVLADPGGRTAESHGPKKPLARMVSSS